MTREYRESQRTPDGVIQVWRQGVWRPWHWRYTEPPTRSEPVEGRAWRRSTAIGCARVVRLLRRAGRSRS